MSKINKIDVLEAALSLSSLFGYRNITRELIAMRVGISTGSVSSTLGTMEKIKWLVVDEAIKRERLDIIAEAVIDKHLLTKNLDVDIKIKALASV